MLHMCPSTLECEMGSLWMQQLRLRRRQLGVRPTMTGTSMRGVHVMETGAAIEGLQWQTKARQLASESRKRQKGGTPPQVPETEWSWITLVLHFGPPKLHEHHFCLRPPTGKLVLLCLIRPRKVVACVRGGLSWHWTGSKRVVCNGRKNDPSKLYWRSEIWAKTQRVKGNGPAGAWGTMFRTEEWRKQKFKEGADSPHWRTSTILVLSVMFQT